MMSILCDKRASFIPRRGTVLSKTLIFSADPRPALLLWEKRLKLWTQRTNQASSVFASRWSSFNSLDATGKLFCQTILTHYIQLVPNSSVSQKYDLRWCLMLKTFRCLFIFPSTEIESKLLLLLLLLCKNLSTCFHALSAICSFMLNLQFFTSTPSSSPLACSAPSTSMLFSGVEVSLSRILSKKKQLKTKMKARLLSFIA